MLALRPGATADQTIQQLRLTSQDASNVAGASAGRTPIQVVEQYVAWAENAERMLGNVLAHDLIDDLVHTPRYWTLRTARGDEPRLTATVLAEVEQRRHKLDALLAELEVEGARWTEGHATIVVPDTNMFLRESAPFEAINWPDSVHSDVAVRLVIPLVVVHELDRLKRQGNNMTAKLARAALRWLLEVLPSHPSGRSSRLSAPTPGTTAEVYVHGGPSRPNDADGVIIEVTRWLGTVSSLPTLLVTRDLGMRLRAAALDVEAVQLPDS